MATFTTVLALLAFLAAGSTSGQNSQDKVLSLNPIWIMDKAFAAKHGKAKLDELITKLRAVLQGLETEATTGKKVSLGLFHNFGKASLASSLPPTKKNFRALSYTIEKLLQRGAAGWSKAGAYIAVSGEATGNDRVVATASVCHAKKYFRVALLRYIKDDDTTVKAMAQAIGLLLGINVDSVTTGNRGTCANAGGYMDFVPKAKRWTSCSKADFKKLYNANKLACL